MSWSYRYDSDALSDFGEAYGYYLYHHPGVSIESFVDLVNEAFRPALQFPESRPQVRLPRQTQTTRRVRVWRFSFLYEVDAEAQELIIVRIVHERAASL